MSDSETRTPEELRIEAWLHGAVHGRREDIDSLCRHFVPGLRVYVQRKMGPRARRWDDPEDIVQEVLRDILAPPARLPEGLNESRLRARLYRAATKRILEHLRRHERDLGASVVLSGLEQPAPELPPVVHNDQREIIAALVDHLPDDYREIVRLCGLEGLSCAEAARRLGMNQATLRKRYDKARFILELKLRQRRDGH